MSSSHSKNKTTLSVSRDVSMAVKGAAALSKLSLYEYVNQALAFAVRTMRVTIETGEKEDEKHSS